MVIEDNAEIREGISDYLRLLGWDVLPARHGREALEKINERDILPCVILLDLAMPVMDGLTFRRHQLADPKLRDVPVCIISGEYSVRETARALAVDDYLVKPFNFQVLADTVDSLAKCSA